MSSNTFLFLFSGGQDSMIFLVFYFLQQSKTFCYLLAINHQSQIQSNHALFHNLKLVTFTQQKLFFICFTVLMFEKAELNEQVLRIARYQITFRMKIFYRVNYFLTGQTKSDLLETFLFTFARGFQTTLVNITLDKKILIKKFYHQNLNLFIFSEFKGKKVTKKSRKKLKMDFSLQTANSEKIYSIFSRPLKDLSRLSLFQISKKLKLPIFVDKTNFSSSISRNLIRRHIIIYFQGFLNPLHKADSSLVSKLMPKEQLNLIFLNFLFQTFIFYFIFKNTIIFSVINRKDYYYFKSRDNEAIDFNLLFCFLFMELQNEPLFLKFKEQKIYFQTKNYSSFSIKFL